MAEILIILFSDIFWADIYKIILKSGWHFYEIKGWKIRNILSFRFLKTRRISSEYSTGDSSSI